MRVVANGAQRASRRSRSGRMLALFASILALILLISLPATASAASIKVVIVVGPVESTTAKYISDARALAAQARSYGANVIEIYSPRASWYKVKKAATGDPKSVPPRTGVKRRKKGQKAKVWHSNH